MNPSETPSSYSEETLSPKEILASKIDTTLEKMNDFFENIDIQPSPEDSKLIKYFLEKVDGMDINEARQIGTMAEIIGRNEEYLISLDNNEGDRFPPDVSYRSSKNNITEDFQLSSNGTLTVNRVHENPEIGKSISKVIELLPTEKEKSGV